MKILIIDDEFAALTKMKTMLSHYGECEVASCGKEALELVKIAMDKKEYFDLITIDIGLPDINGISLLKRISLLEVNSPQKAMKVMITATSTTENVIKAQANRCDGFLVKPIRKEILKEKLKSLNLI